MDRDLLSWISRTAKEGQQAAERTRGCNVKGAHYLKALRTIEARVDGLLRALPPEQGEDGAS